METITIRNNNVSNDVSPNSVLDEVQVFGRINAHHYNTDVPIATDLGVVEDAVVTTMVSPRGENRDVRLDPAEEAMASFGDNIVPVPVPALGRSASRRKFFRSVPLANWVKRKFTGRLVRRRGRGRRVSTILRTSSGGYSFHELYRTGSKLGEGAFSTVLEGTNKQTNDSVAVKAVDKARLSTDDAVALQDEIAILREIDHPNIIHLYDVFDEADRCYLITERVYGGELFDRVVRKSYFDETEAREVCKGLFSAVQFIHSRNIAHRDLKPENVLFETEDDNSVVKLADFGFAKKCSGPNSLLTQCGTPRYVAPEILEGLPYGTQCDMWSLGVIVYVMLGGYPPFTEANDRDLFRKIRRGDFVFHDEFWEHVSIEAKDFIRSLLTVDPARRITAADALESPWMLGETLGFSQFISVRSMSSFENDNDSVVSDITMPHIEGTQSGGPLVVRNNTCDEESKKTQAGAAPIVASPDLHVTDAYIERWMKRRKEGRAPEDDFERATRVGPIQTPPPPPLIQNGQDASQRVGANPSPPDTQSGGLPASELPFTASAYYSAVANKLNANATWSAPSASNSTEEADCEDATIDPSPDDPPDRPDDISDSSDDPVDSTDSNVNSPDDPDDRPDDISDNSDDPVDSTDTEIQVNTNENKFCTTEAAANIEGNVPQQSVPVLLTSQSLPGWTQDSNKLVELPILQALSCYANSTKNDTEPDTIALLHSFASNTKQAKPNRSRPGIVRSQSFSEGMGHVHYESVAESILRRLSSYLRATRDDSKQDSIELLHSFASMMDHPKVVNNSLWNGNRMCRSLSGSVVSAGTELVEHIPKCLSTYLDSTKEDIKPDSISLLHTFATEAANKMIIATPSGKVKDNPDDRSNNVRKVFVVGELESGKSSIARWLTTEKNHLCSNPFVGGCENKRFVVNIHSWKSIDAEEKRNDGSVVSNSTFKVFDFPGNAHLAPQSIFHSRDSIYCLPWDMGANNPKTWGQSKRPKPSFFHPSPSNDSQCENVDEYSTEDADRIADRELERDIQEKVIFWIDNIIQTADDEGAILPLASFNNAFDTQEAQRRCDMMKKCLLEHYERLKQAKSKPLPKLLFENGDGTNGERSILRIGNLNDEEACELKKLIKSSTEACSSFSGHMGTESWKTTQRIRKKVRELKSKYKIAHLDHILSELNADHGNNLEKVDIVGPLQDLCRVGELIYFAGPEKTLHVDDARSDQLSSLSGEFVVLCPKWLSAVTSCFLKTDLPREVAEARRSMPEKGACSGKPLSDWWDACSSCSSISNEDASAIWKSVNYINEAVENAAEMIDKTSSYVFGYLYDLLSHHGVISPVIASPCVPNCDKCHHQDSLQKSTLSIVPSSLSSVPSDVWSYRSKDPWKGTLSHAWYFEGCIPPRLMDQVTASVIQDLFDNSCTRSRYGPCHKTEGAEEASSACGQKLLSVQAINCWKDALMVDLGMKVRNPRTREHVQCGTKIFIHLDANNSTYCLAPNSMSNGARRLVISAAGESGQGCHRIWEGGLRLLSQSIEHVLREIGGNYKVKRQIVCPECMLNHHQSDVHIWTNDSIQKAVQENRQDILCSNGHYVETKILCGIDLGPSLGYIEAGDDASKVVDKVYPSVVQVALWNDKTQQIERCASGFIADCKNGLIVTAAHALIDIRPGKNFGKNYYGLKNGKALIGVIPQPSHKGKGSKARSQKTKAEFRYTAKIVEKDVGKVDACVLQITGRIGQVSDKDFSYGAVGKEKLQHLKFAKHECNLDEKIQIIGYNQGGEGLLDPNMNQYLDFVRGYVCKKFRPYDKMIEEKPPDRCKPQKEIVVMCPAIGGHSGGPCVNNEGAVVGILSRADPVDCRRYLVPTSEIKPLLKKAVRVCANG